MAVFAGKSAILLNVREMTIDSRQRDPIEANAFPKAFLVVRRGGRWTDLLRLAPNKTAVIGRSSNYQIVIRSHQASRQHAEIRWDDGRWWVRDLSSRNGTVVAGQRIETACPLAEGSRIEVAGCAMTFVSRVADALITSTASSLPSASRRDQDQLNPGQPLVADQLTMEGIGSESIVQRLLRAGGKKNVLLFFCYTASHHRFFVFMVNFILGFYLKRDGI